jgi:FecR protein
VHATAQLRILRSFFRRGSFLPAVLVLIASLGAHAADDAVGSISDVEGAAEIVSSGQSAGAADGAAVHMNDELKTGADGHLQVTFRDDTVLTLGEDARVVIDRYVFDPDQGVGDVLLTTTQGAFRFATGRLKDLSSKDITVATPVAETCHGDPLAAPGAAPPERLVGRQDRTRADAHRDAQRAETARARTPELQSPRSSRRQGQAPGSAQAKTPGRTQTGRTQTGRA